MKKVLVACDDYVYRVDGKFYFKEFGLDLVKRYLLVFDSVRFAVRVKDMCLSELGIYNILLEDDRIEVYPIPFFQGPLQFLFKYFFTTQFRLKNIVLNCNVCVARVPSTVASIVLYQVMKKKVPYAVEVVANPKGIMNFEQKGLYKIVWYFIHKRLQYECAKADCASYVTQFGLQKIYPALKPEHFETFYSSIELNEDFYYNKRNPKQRRDVFIISHVSHPMKSYLKGHITVIDTLKKLKELGYKNVLVKFAGDGLLKDKFMDYAKMQNVDDQVHFVGLLEKKQLRNFLIESDLMLFPSHSEGLPRVLIEAMATSLPCLSSPVDGIPELISNEYLFHPNDSNGFANKIVEIMNSDNLYNKMCIENYIKALEYEKSILMIRRKTLYSRLYDKSK